MKPKNSKTYTQRLVTLALGTAILYSGAYSQDKSGSRPGLIKTPKAGGTVLEESSGFEILSNKGASSFQLSLPDLPSRTGFSPSLSLNYNQFAGDRGDGFGIGWQISIASITISDDLGIPLPGKLTTGEFRNIYLLGGEPLIFQGRVNGRLHYKPQSSKKDINVYYYEDSYRPAHARAVGDLIPEISSGFEVVLPNGQRQLFSGNFEVAEGRPEATSRFPLVFEIAPTGESIAYRYTKTDGRSYLSEVIFADGKSRYEFESMPGLANLVSFRNGIAQNNQQLYAKMKALYNDQVREQWCFVFVGRNPAAREVFEVKTHSDCKAQADIEFEDQLNKDSLTILDQLVGIYRYGNDQNFNTQTLRLPDVIFDYSSWTKDFLSARDLVFPLGQLVDATGFSIENYELSDVNHDGLVDALKRRSNGSSQVYYGSGGQHQVFSEPKVWALQRGNKTISPDMGSDAFHFADFNGDSYVDIAEITDSEGTHIYLGQETGGFQWTGRPTTLSNRIQIGPKFFQDGAARFLDINGDGKSDILTSGRNLAGDITWKVLLNLSRQDARGFWQFSFVEQSFAANFSNRKLSDRDIKLTDINGDSLPDLINLRSSNIAGESGICVYLNRGDLYYLSEDELLFGDPQASSEICGRAGQFIRLNGMPGTDSLNALWIADVNGDGIADIASMGERIDELLVWLGFGDLNISPTALEIPLNRGVKLYDRLRSRSRIADVDGDGQDEILIFDESAAGEDRVMMIDFNRTKNIQLVKSNLLTTIAYSSGLRHDIKYTTSVAERLRDQRNGLEIVPLHFPLILAKQVVSSQGIPSLSRKSIQVKEFFYHRPYYNPSTKEFLGFSEVETLFYGDQYSEESYLERSHYYTFSEDIGSLELAGTLKSQQFYSLQEDPFFAEQSRLNNHFNPEDPLTHSMLDYSERQSLPETHRLLKQSEWHWQTVSASRNSYFLRLLSSKESSYDITKSTDSNPAVIEKFWEDYDEHNLPLKSTEIVHAVTGPNLIQMPEVITSTEVDYALAREQLALLHILDRPDFMLVQRGGKIKDFETYSYNEAGQLKSITSHIFSNLGQAPTSFSQIWQQESTYTQSTTYDEFGNPIRSFDDFGTFEEIIYDDRGVLPIKKIVPKTSRQASDEVWTFAYRGDGRLKRFTNPLGLTTEISYDSLGRRTALVASDGSEETYEYRFAKDGSPAFVLTSLRRYSSDTTTPKGERSWVSRLEAFQPDGTKLADVEDTSSKTDGITGIRVKNYQSFDRNRRVIFKWTPYSIGDSNLSTRRVFEDYKDIPTPENQVGIRYSYDSFGRIARKDFPSKSEDYRYFPWGNLVLLSYESNSQKIQFRRLEVENKFGLYAVIEQNATNLSDPLLVADSYPESSEVIINRYERDDLGHLSAMLPAGETQPRKMVSDNLGRLEQQSIPGLGTYTYINDERGRVTHIVRGNASDTLIETIEQVYDTRDRLTKRLINGGLHSAYQYDYYETPGQRPASTYHNSVTTPTGLLTNRISVDPNGFYDTIESFAYDRHGRTIAQKVRIGDQQFSESYGFSLDGTNRQIMTPGGLEGRFGLDAAGYLNQAQIKLPGAHQWESVIEEVSYNAEGQIETILYRQIGDTYAQTELGYDPSTLQLVSIRSQYLKDQSLQPLQDLSLTVDGNQSITHIDDHMNQASWGHVSRTGRFTYDWRDQLIRAERYGKTYQYRYNTAGAFTRNEEFSPEEMIIPKSSGLIPASTSAKPYQFDGFGQLSSNPRLKSARFDALGRLLQLETYDQKIFFGYSDSGMRTYKLVIEKEGAASRSSYYPFPSYTVEGQSGAQSFIAIKGSRIARYDHGNGQWYYYLKDHLGSSDLIMHSSGQPVEQMLYYAYGSESAVNEMSDSWSQYEAQLGSIAPLERTHHRYTGQYLDDETGIYYMKSRYYDPKIGRFLSPDRFYLEDPEKCIENPLECNLYSYARNNPMKYHDPSGKFGLLGAVLGGGLDFAAQVFIEGKSLGEVNYKSVALSAGAGALGAGLGAGVAKTIVGSGARVVATRVAVNAGGSAVIAGGQKAVSNVLNGADDFSSITEGVGDAALTGAVFGGGGAAVGEGIEAGGRAIANARWNNATLEQRLMSSIVELPPGTGNSIRATASSVANVSGNFVANSAPLLTSGSSESQSSSAPNASYPAPEDEISPMENDCQCSLPDNGY